VVFSSAADMMPERRKDRITANESKDFFINLLHVFLFSGAILVVFHLFMYKDEPFGNLLEYNGNFQKIHFLSQVISDPESHHELVADDWLFRERRLSSRLWNSE
jgi:hypothetical protein